MSWDRVIQDSDEDEPLGDDGVVAPVPIDSPQGHEATKQQLLDNMGHHVVEQQANYPTEHPPAQEVGPDPDLGVNFDQFLQSQQSSMTLSQQRREHQWIPSTGDGGGGSIGVSESRCGRFS